MKKHMYQVATILAFLLVWQLINKSGYVFEGIFPTVTEILTQIGKLLINDVFWSNMKVSLKEILFGFVIGSLLGVIVGGIIGSQKGLREVFEPLIFYLGAIPKIIFFPIFLWFLGAGVSSKIGMSALSAFFPMSINTCLALLQVKPVHVQAARLLGAKRIQLWMKVYIPSTIGYILIGARMGMGVAIVGALLSETSVANSGIGYLAIKFYSRFQIPELYATVLIIFLGATLVNWFLSALIKKFSPQEEKSAEQGFF